MNPSDPDVRAAAEAIRAGARNGAYASTAAWADALPEPIRRTPEVALERARVRLRQGHILLAGAALDEARIEDAPRGMREQLEMERAAVLIVRDSKFDEALAIADAALARAAGVDNPVQRARVAAGQARVVLQAASHFTAPPGAVEAASASLRAAAEVLEREGCVDEALAARLLLAMQEQQGAPRLAALAAGAELALGAGRPHPAAEARAARAEILMKQAPVAEVLAELDAAETLYAGHETGAVDVRRLRARLAADREAADTAELEECLRLYREADLPGRAFAVLLDLAHIAQGRGDVARAVEWRTQAIALAHDVGMGVALPGLEMAQADLLTRAGDYAGAISCASTPSRAGFSPSRPPATNSCWPRRTSCPATPPGRCATRGTPSRCSGRSARRKAHRSRRHGRHPLSRTPATKRKPRRC